MKCLAKFVVVLAAAALLLQAAERFDYLVRGDFFAGLAGDQPAMDRAMKLCEDTLARDPKHPEALVWHGSGLMVTAGKAFGSGDMAKGGQLWAQGLRQMSEAVALAPANVAVLIPRGATLLTSGVQMPQSAQSRALIQQGVADYETVYQIQKPRFESLPAHSRGELLFGLATGYDHLDQKDRARSTFETLLAVGKASGHETEARQWLETGAYTAQPMQCTGCHARHQ